MRAASITAVQLSARSGVSRPTISEILNRRTDAEDATLHRLSKAINWPIPDLVARLPTRPSSRSARVTGRVKKSAAVDPHRYLLRGGEDVVSRVGAAIRAAVREAMERDERERVDAHRRLLGELLTDLGVHLEKNGIRATELLQVAMSLRKGRGTAE